MTNEELRKKCIRCGWFTCGDISQYNKLFDLNAAGADVEKLAVCIWLCTEDMLGWSINEIMHELSKGEEK